MQQDASLSIEQLAERVNLSRNACWRRVKRLEEEGIIRARVVLADPARLNLELTVFIAVRTARHEADWAARFGAAVQDIPRSSASIAPPATSTTSSTPACPTSRPMTGSTRSSPPASRCRTSRRASSWRRSRRSRPCRSTSCEGEGPKAALAVLAREPPPVMPGPVPGIHEFSSGGGQVVDARHKGGHDGWDRDLEGNAPPLPSPLARGGDYGVAFWSGRLSQAQGIRRCGTRWSPSPRQRGGCGWGLRPAHAEPVTPAGTPPSARPGRRSPPARGRRGLPDARRPTGPPRSSASDPAPRRSPRRCRGCAGRRGRGAS